MQLIIILHTAPVKEFRYFMNLRFFSWLRTTSIKNKAGESVPPLFCIYLLSKVLCGIILAEEINSFQMLLLRDSGLYSYRHAAFLQIFLCLPYGEGHEPSVRKER